MKRRPQGTGSVFQKRPGPGRPWMIQFYVDGRRRREAGGPTRGAAQRKLTELLSRVNRDEFVARERKPALVEQLFLALEKDYRHNEGKRGRAEGLRRRWKHLAPEFGKMRAASLSTDDVRRYIEGRKQQGAANATVNRELSTLKRMFNFGRQDTPPKVRTVPYIPMLKEDNVRKGFVEDAAFAQLAAEASELWLRTFLELGFTYGWRKSELLSLRVKQVDLPQRTIRLEAGTTKNGEGREVTMTTKVAELLRLAVAGKAPEDFVLTRERKIGKQTVRRPVRSVRVAWRNLCVRAGLGGFVCRKCERVVTATKRKRCECGARGQKYRGLIPHDLRRSAAKALRRAGVPESVVMAQGGWKTAAMFRRYAIVSSADNRAAVEMLEKARAELSLLVASSTPKTASPAPEARSAKVN
jgi:integrase